MKIIHLSRRMYICLLSILLAGCGKAATETLIPLSTVTLLPPTDTPTITLIPQTYSPEPPSCEEVEENCLELTFDGEKCSYEGPTEIEPGPFTLLFFNEDEGIAQVVIFIHTGDETSQDMIDYIGKEPTWKHGPAWTEILHHKSIGSGTFYPWETSLGVGVHSLWCVDMNPTGGWYGAGITVID